MARKTSIKQAAERFLGAAYDIAQFAERSSASTLEADRSWIYDYAVLRLYREFEALVLAALVGAINNDTSTLSATTGRRFPKHLTAEVCEFIVTGGRYFDFKGRDGLIKLLKQYVPPTHYLVTTISNQTYRTALDTLVGLRNFVAHSSDQARSKALEVTGRQRLSSAGAWLRRVERHGDTRFSVLLTKLSHLAHDIRDAAPF